MAGYNKEALQKIVDTYEKKIAEYKIKVEEIQKKQAKMMEFMKGFGVFSEELMGKLIEQVGNAKGNISSLMGLLGAGKRFDLEEAFRRGRRGQFGRGKNGMFALEDSERLFLDDLYEKPGIVYHLNENLFKEGEVEEDFAQKRNGGVNCGETDGEINFGALGEESAQAGDTFEAEINGKVVTAQKFVVFDQEGNEVYREDLFDENGKIREDLVLFDSMGHRIEDVNSLMDRNGVWKLKSKQQESLKRKRRNNRERLLVKELNRVMKEKCICGREMPNTKTDKFLTSEVFTRFKDKLDREEALEIQCRDFFAEIMKYLEQRDQREAVLHSSIIEREAEVLEGLSNRWVKQISDLKRRMEFYQNPKRIRIISTAELSEFSGRLKKMLRVYQEERIRRTVIRELKGDNPNLVVNNGNLDDEMIGLGNVKKELAEAARAREALLAASEGDFKTLEDWMAVADFEGVVTRAEKELGDEVDKIYDDNYNIQNFFFNFSKSVEANYSLLDNKIVFLSQMLYRRFIDREAARAKRPRKAVKIWSRRLSVRNLKEAKKRPMFKNIDRLAQSDIMFLYKNVQEKLENFMKMQKDIGKLGSLGAIDDIKNMINMMGDQPETPVENGAKAIKADPTLEQNPTANEPEATDTTQEQQRAQQEMPEVDRAPGESEEGEYEDEDEYDEDEEYEEEEEEGIAREKRNRMTQHSHGNVSQDTHPFDHNIERLYGIKKNEFVNKFMPVMKARNRGSVVQSETQVRDKRKNKTFSYKATSQEMEFLKREKAKEEEEEEYSEDYGEYDEEDEELESINDSDNSEESGPYEEEPRGHEESEEEEEQDRDDNRNDHIQNQNHNQQNGYVKSKVLYHAFQRFIILLYLILR